MRRTLFSRFIWKARSSTCARTTVARRASGRWREKVSIITLEPVKNSLAGPQLSPRTLSLPCGSKEQIPRCARDDSLKIKTETKQYNTPAISSVNRDQAQQTEIAQHFPGSQNDGG